MKEGRIEVIVNRDIPKGYCAVMMDGNVVYSGQIGRPLVPFITNGAVLILHPVDYEDGAAFMRPRH